jgi:hypothetical protein
MPCLQLNSPNSSAQRVVQFGPLIQSLMQSRSSACPRMELRKHVSPHHCLHLGSVGVLSIVWEADLR